MRAPSADVPADPVHPAYHPGPHPSSTARPFVGLEESVTVAVEAAEAARGTVELPFGDPAVTVPVQSLNEPSATRHSPPPLPPPNAVVFIPSRPQRVSELTGCTFVAGVEAGAARLLTIGTQTGGRRSGAMAR